MTRLSLESWILLASITLAGALAVPLDPVQTPLSALVTGLVGLLGIVVWRWSRLAGNAAPWPAGPAFRMSRSLVFLAIGLGIGLLLLGVMRLVLEPVIPALGIRIAAAGTLPVWRRLLIIYVAAVGEELLFRLLLMSLLAGLAARLLRRVGREPAPADILAANLLAALAFAAVHLPAWSGATSLSLGLAAAVVGLNMIGGVVLGHLFVTRGIVAAMLAHSGADMAIQLIGPLTG